MSQTLRVENLGHDATANDLVQLFRGFGEVRKVELLADSQIGNGTVLGLVEMTSDIQARRAVAALDDEDYQGRVLGVRPIDQCAVSARSRRRRSSRWSPSATFAGPRRGDFGDRSGRGKND
jgi:RNA recognition motif-containing protein